MAAWLNHAGGDKAQQGVLRLMADLRQLEEAGHQDDREIRDLHVRKFAEAQSSASRKVIHKDELRINRDYAKIGRRVDRLLSKCSMRPSLVSHDGGAMGFGWRYSDPLCEGFHLLITVAQMGFLDRILRCANANCGKWFFAKFSHENHCNPVCQRRAYQSSEQWKEKRRAWYRDHRQSKKRLGVTKLRLADRV